MDNHDNIIFPRRGLVIVIEHETIGDKRIWPFAKQMLLEYIRLHDDGKVGNDSASMIESTDGWRLTEFNTISIGQKVHLENPIG